MSFVRGEITQFWSQVRETRQLMSNSEDNLEKDTKIQNETKEEDKENKKKKKKGNTRKREHVSNAIALEERKGNRCKVPKVCIQTKTAVENDNETKINHSRAKSRKEGAGTEDEVQ